MAFAGALKTTLQTIPASSPVTETVRDLQALDSRLDAVDLLPKPTYGSAAAGPLTGTSQSLRGTLGASGGGDGSPASTRRGTTTLAAGMPEDWGSPALTPAMQKLASSIRPLDQNKQRHRPGRLKLTSLAMSAVQSKLMNTLEAPKEELQVVVLLADWSPVCSRLEAAAQTANRELVDEGTANPASPSGHVKVRCTTGGHVDVRVWWMGQVIKHCIGCCSCCRRCGCLTVAGCHIRCASCRCTRWMRRRGHYCRRNTRSALSRCE